MQHFANFIRLSDKNLNTARGLLTSAKNNSVNNWSQLSGFKPDSMGTALKMHDTLQHRLIDKPIFKAATNLDPNSLYRNNSLQQKTTMLPLVQNRQLENDKRGQVNQTIEKLVDVVSQPESAYRLPFDTSNALPNTKYEAVMPYIKKKFSQPDRLAGMKLGQQLDYMDNERFRNTYKSSMRDEEIRKGRIKPTFQLESSNLPATSTRADTLKAKLVDRRNYTETLNNRGGDMNEREGRLDTYRKTGLMPR